MSEKIIVFDLDNTIGFFEQFIYILNCISTPDISYNYLFDLFPECFRPNIFEIFTYLLQQKKNDKYSFSENISHSLTINNFWISIG